MIVFLQFTILGLSFLLPNYSQLVCGAGETEAGSILLLGCIVGAVMAPVSGQLLDHLGASIPILTGAALAVAGTVTYAVISPSMSVLTMIVVYVIFAGGQSLMYGNNMTCALGFLPADIKADGNAMFTTLQQLAGAMGTSVAAALVNAAQVGVSTDGMAAATAAGTQHACMLLVVTVCVSLACAATEMALRRRAA